MPYTGVYPVTDHMSHAPRDLAIIARYDFQLNGLLPEALEAASVLLNLSQRRAEANQWVWVSKDSLLNLLRQDISAYQGRCLSLQLTDTFVLPKRGYCSRLLDFITRGWYTSYQLRQMKKRLGVPKPLAADPDRGELSFIRGLHELVHAGLARRLPRHTDGQEVVFYAPTDMLVCRVYHEHPPFFPPDTD